jgi:hypothetical protein
MRVVSQSGSETRNATSLLTQPTQARATIEGEPRVNGKQHTTEDKLRILRDAGVNTLNRPGPAKHSVASLKSKPDRQKIVLFFMMLLGLFSSQAFAAVGGGYTACGLTGEYFPNNQTLTGPAAFVRQDNRLNFNWLDTLPVGASSTPAFRTFPHDNFSARWTGSLVPRFSENYTFTADAADGVRVWLNNNLIIDNWTNSDAPVSSTPVSLTAGTTYAIKVEYYHNSGNARMILKWSSPSTPQEVIDPLSVNGFNLTNCLSTLFADDEKYCLGDDSGAPSFWFPAGDARASGLPSSELDSLLWPETDAVMRVNPVFPNGTTYQIQFSGKADVTCTLRWYGGQGTFTVNGVSYTNLPNGVGYDPVSNTTTALMTSPLNDNPLATYSIGFANTQRDQNSAVGTGITNLHIMRPQSQAAGAPPCDLGTIVYPGVKAALQNYTVYRYFSDAFTDESLWEERTLPGMPSFSGSPPQVGDWADKPCWEYLIMLANEMGKDLYFSISSRADQNYYTNLANLVQYGSDGVNPYTSTSQWPASGPVYPPLNPNLRFYVEYSNEVWNYGFAQAGYIYQDSMDAVNLALGNTLTDTPAENVTAADGEIIDYDGNGYGNWQRWQALQTVHISDAFRAVCGDAAMGDRIRVLMFDQYGGYGINLGQFIDNYFNQTDPQSTDTGTAHPVNYYIWGGGGAIYYGSDNPTGIDPDLQFTNGSFETPALAQGAVQVTPNGSGWTFTGNAGIYNNISRVNAISVQTLGSVTSPSQGQWVGFKFTVGSTPIYVYDVGRLVAPANSGVHPINIFTTSGTGFLANQINTSGSAANQYAWTRVNEQGWTRNPQIPLLLESNTTYYVMSYESSDSYYGQSTVASSPGITINCAATASGSQYGVTTFTDGSISNTAYGLANFTFTDTPQGDLGFTCDAPDGTQAAFIGDTGAMSQTVNFNGTGTYALGFYAAGGGINGANAVNFYVDGVNCTPLNGDNPSWQVSASPWTPGGFERIGNDLTIWWGSAVFPITTAGAHTIKIQGTGAAGQYIFFDDIQLLSTDTIYGPNGDNFPSTGEANGQPLANPGQGLINYVSSLQAENRWSAAWGLKTMAYEGGWSVGGDFDQKPIDSYCKYVDPQTISADENAINTYTSTGGSLFCYYYSQWPDFDVDNATQYPLVQSVIQRNNFLPVEASYGTVIPATLNAANSTLYAVANADSAGNLTAQGAWVDWNIIVPQSQTYNLTSTVSGTGGSYVLLADDATTVLTGSAGGNLSGTVWLTKGQHAIKVRSTGTTQIGVQNIVVTMPGAPVSPAQPAATFGNGSAVIAWPASPGAAGYIVYIGTSTGNYSSSMDVGNTTSITLPGLKNSSVYYVAIQAYDSNHLLSLASTELRFAQRSTYPQFLVDFENLTVDGSIISNGVTEGDYYFSAWGNTGDLQVQGTSTPPPWNLWPGGWPSNVLMTVAWGDNSRIQRADGNPFDLYSLDLCSIYGGFSATIVGHDPSGATFEQIVNFPNSPQFVIPVTLDWVRVTEVDIYWNSAPDGGGTSQRFGAIDNVLFNKSVDVLNILAPANLSFVTSNWVSVAGTASSVVGIQGVQVNGSAGSTANAWTNWNGVATGLARGTNLITVVATDTASLSTTNFVQVIYAGAPLYSTGDGIPDWWRQSYFGGDGTTTSSLSCATCDADGTGQNNLFKYVAGLDPTNPASIFVLQIASTNQPTQVNLLFNPVVTGRTYTPQYTTDLVSGVWLPLTTYTGPVINNGNQATITDTNPIPPQEFYRIGISLP